MPHLFLFLIKVNIALLVFCAGYYLVLRQLTFYTLNRIYLAAGILFASLYPKINLSAFLQQHQHIAEPMQAIAFRIQAPPKMLINPITHHGYWQYAALVFWIGAAVLAIRLLVQFISLYRIYINSREGELDGHKVRLISGDGGPFSFWKSIYINPERHEPADLTAILQHEQIHVREWHTADILLAELSTIFYWFNPGIWMMKKAIRENIEFITDRKILQTGADSKQYQYSLVNVSFAVAPQGIVNHFNISTIKKRIIMMNAKRSSNFKLTRYAFLVPALVALLLVVTVSRAALVKKASRYRAPISAIKSEMVRTFEKAHWTVKVFTQGKKEIKLLTPDTTKHAKAPVATKIDTNKNAEIVVKGNKLTIEPSMYIVDGVVVKGYEISKADTNKIVSINIGKSNKDGKSVVYITTQNGLNSKRINSFTITGAAAKNLKGTVSSANVFYVDTLKGTEGYPQLDTVYVQGFNSTPLRTFPLKQGKPITLKGSRFNTIKGSPVTTYAYTSQAFGSSEFSLSHLSDKLIIIDGNIATKADLKRLSAFDIDRMVLKTDDETKELYGDKAKNGVVFIVTKKK